MKIKDLVVCEWYGKLPLIGTIEYIFIASKTIAIKTKLGLGMFNQKDVKQFYRKEEK